MEELKKYSVYVHTFPNGKKYVGVTCLPVNARWCNGKGYDNHKKMSEAIKEFGWENVKHETSNKYNDISTNNKLIKLIDLIQISINNPNTDITYDLDLFKDELQEENNRIESSKFIV